MALSDDDMFNDPTMWFNKRQVIVAVYDGGVYYMQFLIPLPNVAKNLDIQFLEEYIGTALGHKIDEDWEAGQITADKVAILNRILENGIRAFNETTGEDFYESPFEREFPQELLQVVTRYYRIAVRARASVL
ncbi:hypothetical protein IWW47_000888 [Coemansia sp. RSA 2052]|nr:hypothetical protein IWW47_000888 [Coemansia sp. RSA 2052]